MDRLYLDNDLWNDLLIVIVSKVVIVFAVICFVYVHDVQRPFHISFIKCLQFYYYILYTLSWIDVLAHIDK